jgi:hypothetical protein
MKIDRKKGEIMYLTIKTIIKKISVFLVLLFISFSIFAEEHDIGKMLIMGWYFDEDDTSIQTNMAINAIINYAEAARLRMNSYERYDSSCKTELYRVYNDVFYDGRYFEISSVFIYINITMDSMIKNSNIIIFQSEDYHDRSIEIDFFIIYNEIPSKYKLVLYYNDYNWIKNNKGNNQYELISRGDRAYDFFINEIRKLRR